MGLNEQLSALRTKLDARFPEAAKAIMHRAIEELRKSGIAQRVPKSGTKAPEFSLPNQNGTMVSLGAMLKNGPVVVNFYRGEW